jgi:hypothetical protein
MGRYVRCWLREHAVGAYFGLALTISWLRPGLPLIVGLDGGYVHSSQQRSKRDGWFKVIARKSMPAAGPPKCFGFVQTYDRKPKRRLFEVLKSQGMAMNQQVVFLTDGGEDVRDLPCT